MIILERNLRKSRKLRIALKDLKKSQLKVWKSIEGEEVMIRSLNKKITKERDIIRELINSEVAFKVNIGRVKGLHCPAKQRCIDFTPYYNCILASHEAQLELSDFYEDCCFPCKLSMNAICTGTLMWKLAGKRED